MPDIEATPQQQVVYVIPSQGLPRVYCNNVQMATTSFDVRIIFGEILAVDPAETPARKITVEQNVQVTMSWIEAKILADFLQANVKAHEDLNGPIKLTKNPDKIVVPPTFGPPVA